MIDKVQKLKKYLFLMSIIFLFTSFSHLTYNYLYSDSKLIPEIGGSISEGLIGNFPSLNPLKPSDANNDYIISLLYRSLLKYDIKEKKIVSDIANCDISSLLYIECYVKDNIGLSSGEYINAEDIVSTYKLLQNTDTNPVLKSLLSETTIESKDNIVTFSNERSDVNFLNVFFQPIVSKNVLDNLTEEQINGSFSSFDGVYSGKLKIVNVSNDESIGITKIVLEKNEGYKENDILLDQYIIKLFPDTNSFIKNKLSVNIFNDTENLLGKSIARFDNNKYSLSQYVSVFVNQENIENANLRAFLLKQINRDNLIKILGESNFSKELNPFLLKDVDLEPSISNKNFRDLINELGYYNKSKLIEDFNINFKPSQSFSSEVKLEEKPSEEVAQEEKQEEEINEETEDEVDYSNLNLSYFQSDSKVIETPTYVDRYNFVTKDGINLKGRITGKVDSVYINDTKLENYSRGDAFFYYTLSEDQDTLSLGENNYKIYFESSEGKELVDEINFLYNTDKDSLNIEEKEYVEKLIENLKKENEKQKLEENKSKEEREIEAINTLSENEEYKIKLKEIEDLEDNFYYNDEKEKLSFELYYIDTKKDLEKTAIYIKNSLKEIGIQINLNPISIRGLQGILNEKEKYDMILVGVNLGYIDYNIFPYFHSSQAKSGYNLSQVRKTSLDLLLEDIRGSNLSAEDRLSNQNKVLDILAKEQVVKTLYSPKLDLLIDKTIKNYAKFDSLPNRSLRSEILSDTYVKEKKILNLEGKSILGFFGYILSRLND